MPIDNNTLYALILTLTNTLAIGGAAGLLLFPQRCNQPPKRDEAAKGLDLPDDGLQHNHPVRTEPSSRIIWGATSLDMLASRQQR